MTRHLQAIVLAHLSEVNNRPELAETQARLVLPADSNTPLFVAFQDEPFEVPLDPGSNTAARSTLPGDQVWTLPGL